MTYAGTATSDLAAGSASCSHRIVGGNSESAVGDSTLSRAYNRDYEDADGVGNPDAAGVSSTRNGRAGPKGRQGRAKPDISLDRMAPRAAADPEASARRSGTAARSNRIDLPRASNRFQAISTRQVRQPRAETPKRADARRTLPVLVRNARMAPAPPDRFVAN